MFAAVASIDGKLDEEEAGAPAELLANATVFTDPFAREVMSSIATDLDATLQALASSPLQGLDGIKAAVVILDARLTPTEARSFKESVMALGVNIADASGGGVFKRGRISDDEKLALVVVGQLLGLV